MEIHFFKLTVLDALVIDGKRYKNVKAFKLEILEDGECVIKQNFNKTVDIMKKMFIKSLVMIDEDINNTAMQVIEENIMNNVMWIKKDRSGI